MKEKTKVGRPKGSHKEDTLKRILPVARRLFSEKGYAQTTFKDIGKALGISHAAIYSYFPSKLALYLETVAETQHLLLPHYESALKTESSLKARISKILIAMAQEHDKDNTITGLLAAVPIEMRRHPEIYDALIASDSGVMDILLAIFDEAKDKGEIQSRLPSEDLITALFGAGVGVALLQYGTHQSDLTGKMNALVDLINANFFN